MDRDVFFVFGSMCRLLATKVPLKDWQSYADAIWTWSRKKVEKAYEPDVPDFVPNGNPEPPAPVKVDPPPEKAVEQVEKPVYLNDDQVIKFTAHAVKHGFSEMGLIRFLQSQQIKSTLHIPLGKAGLLWEALKNPEVIQQYR